MALKLGHHVMMSDGRKGHIAAILTDGSIDVQYAKSQERINVASDSVTFLKGRPVVVVAAPLTSSSED